MPHTLLVADDSTTIQRVVTLMFATHGITVTGVSDGQQALDALAAAPIDIALISVSLRKVDGLDVVERIRRTPRLRELPVLMMAGVFDTVDEARVRQVGAAGVLSKPLESALVISQVKSLLGIEPQERAAGHSRTDDATAPRKAPRPEPVPLHMDEEWTAEIAPAHADAAPRPAPDTAPPAAVHESASPGQPPRVTPTVWAPVERVEPARRADPPGARAAEVMAAGFGPADAFAVLLAEEQGEPMTPVVTRPSLELSDAMIDRIADRVAERLMQTAFGTTLRGTVHEVSERLVREEIERIRAAAQAQSR